MSNNQSETAENLAGHGLRPIGRQVLVRQDARREHLASGLYVPESKSRELQEDFGVVLAVGPGEVVGGERVPLEVVPGDRVLFKRRPGSALIPDTREGGRPEWKDLLMLREEDIIGVVEDA